MRKSRASLYVCMLLCIGLYSVLQNMNVLSRLITTPSGIEQRAVSTAAKTRMGSLRKVAQGTYIYIRVPAPMSWKECISSHRLAIFLQSLCTSASPLGGLSLDFTFPSRTTTTQPTATLELSGSSMTILCKATLASGTTCSRCCLFGLLLFSAKLCYLNHACCLNRSQCSSTSKGSCV